MRIAALTCSAVLLSGCSWLGLGGNSAPHYSGQQGRYQGIQQQNSHSLHNSAQTRRGGPCEITSPTMPIPPGCRPEQVTIALPQYGNTANNSYESASKPSSNSYGASVDHTAAAAAAANSGTHKYWKRPKLRLNGSLGFETSVSGDAFSPSALPPIYDVLDHANGRTTGSPADGQTQNFYYTPYPVSYTAPDITGTPIPDLSGIRAQGPSISNSDLYPAPFTASIGAEVQLSDHLGLFGNASYTAAEGGNGGGVTYVGNIYRHETTQNYQTTDAAGNPLVTPIALGNPLRNSVYIADVAFANASMEANDMRRMSFDVGGRYYFKDAFPQYLQRPVTPYISASAGGAHYNALEVSQSSSRLQLSDYFDDPSTPQFEFVAERAAQEILEEGWIPMGTVTVGAEWQVTPKAALAFETGVRYEGGRKITSGGETDANIAIPLTLRGSIGF